MTTARLWMLIMAMPGCAPLLSAVSDTPVVLALGPVLKSARETGFCVCFALASILESLEGIGLTIPLTGPAAGLGGFLAARLVERPS